MMDVEYYLQLMFIIMKMNCKWNEKMVFNAAAGGNQVTMDAKAPIGGGTAMTPKELVVAGLCGCTAMDVVALMKKYRQNLESFDIEADVSATESGHPAVFTEAKMVFKFKGAVEPAKAIEAVQLSQTKYCGVSAMLAKAFPIHYTIEVNGEVVGSGQASFQS